MPGFCGSEECENKKKEEWKETGGEEVVRKSVQDVQIRRGIEE